MQSVWASFVVRSVPCRQCGQRNQMGCRPQEFRGGDSSHNNRTRAQAGWQCHTHSVNYQVGTRLGAPGRRHQPRGAKQKEPPAQEVAPTLERPLPGLQGPGRPPSPGMPPPPAEVSLQRRPLCAGGWGAERKSTDAQGRCPEPGPGPWGLRSGSRVGAEPRRGGGAGGGRAAFQETLEVLLGFPPPATGAPQAPARLRGGRDGGSLTSARPPRSSVSCPLSTFFSLSILSQSAPPRPVRRRLLRCSGRGPSGCAPRPGARPAQVPAHLAAARAGAWRGPPPAFAPPAFTGLFGPGRWDRKEKWEWRDDEPAKRQFRVRRRVPSLPAALPRLVGATDAMSPRAGTHGGAWPLHTLPSWGGCRLVLNPRSDCCHGENNLVKITGGQPE